MINFEYAMNVRLYMKESDGFYIRHKYNGTRKPMMAFDYAMKLVLCEIKATDL